MHRITLSVPQKFLCALLISVQPFVSLPAWALAGPASAPKVSAKEERLPNTSQKPALTSVAPSLPPFSDPPRDDEFARVLMVPYPLLPVGDSSLKENRLLAKALQRQSRAHPNDLRPLFRFLDEQPSSVWRASLLCNLGRLMLEQGRFSRAIESWEEAWQLTSHSTNSSASLVADQAFTELAQIHVWMGNTGKFDALLSDAGGRSVLGGGWEKVQSARRARWNQTQTANCGQASIEVILETLGGKLPVKQMSSAAERRGSLSLLELQALARSAGLNYSIVKRSSDSAAPPPRSIVHWRHNHYSAVLDANNEVLFAGDPTFQQFYGRQLRITSQAMDEETTGYVLVPSDSLARGWRRVEAGEAKAVMGAWYWSGPGELALTPSDEKTCEKDPHAMAQYQAHLMLVSLNIVDIPVGYAPPIGPAIFFRATYNQRDDQSEPAPAYSNLGPQWTFDWLTYIEEEQGQDGRLARYVGGGGVLTYTKIVGGWRSDTDANSITYSSGRYELLSSDGSKLVFGRRVGKRVFLTAFTDSAGIEATVQYDPVNGRITTITDAVGRHMVFSYDLTGPNNLMYKITKVRDAFGREARITYDSLGRLKSITDPEGITSTFAYDHPVNRNFITSMGTPYGQSRFSYGEAQMGAERWLTMTDPAGGVEKVHYMQSVAGLSETSYPQVTGFDPMAQAGSLGLRNTFYYTKAALEGNPNTTDSTKAIVYHWMPQAESEAPSRVLESIRPPKESRIWLYYPGQLEGGSAAYNAGAVWLRKPNLIARVVEGIDGQSLVTQLIRLEYNLQGRITSYTDPRGRKTVLAYADNGMDIEQITQVNEASQELLASFGSYNSQHRPQWYKNAGGGTYQLQWNDKGQLEKITPPTGMGLATELHYLGNWNLEYIQRLGGGMKTSFTYDYANRVETVTDPNLFTVTSYYDNLDRVTRVSFPDGSRERFEYERLDLVRAYDRGGNRTDYTYDALGRPLTVSDGDRRITTLKWCGCGGLESITDAREQKTTWVYVDGRLDHKKFNDNSKIEYTYEVKSGRLATVKDARNQIKTYRYNVDDTLKSVLYSQAVLPTPNLEFTYDPVYPRLATVQVAGAAALDQTFQYHPITATPQPGAGQLSAEIINLGGHAVSYSYDLMGRRTTRNVAGADDTLIYDDWGRLWKHRNPLAPLGQEFAYAYALANGKETSRPSSITAPGRGLTSTLEFFDNQGNQFLSQILHKKDTTTLSQFNYKYDSAGRIRQWVQQAGGATPQALTNYYDRSGQLLDQIIAPENGQPTKAYSYTYDNAGNRTAEQIDTLSPNRRSTITTATYNSLNQVTATTGSGSLPVRFAGWINEPGTVTVASGGTTVPAQMTWDDDGPSGRTRFSATLDLAAGTRSATITASDLKNAPTVENYSVEIAGGSTRSFMHDANGNCESMTVDGVTTTYGWDAENRLVRITKGSQTTEIAYDAFSRRRTIIEKTSGTVTSTKHFLWSGLTLVAELDSGYQFTRRFYPEGLQIVNGSQATSYYYTRDHLGSIREVTDSAGTVVTRYDYDPYGRRTRVSGSLDFDFGFTGHYYHAPSGLHLAPFRAYSAELGRWLSRDPVGEEGGVNLYQYCFNDPVNCIDPEGKTPLVTALIGAGIGAAIGAGWALANGGSWSDVGYGALRGGVAGGIAGLTLGLGGSALAGLAGGGIAGGALAGATAGAVGDLAAQGLDNITGRRCGIDPYELAGSAALGGLLGAPLLRPYTAPTQPVTSWAPSGVTPNLNPGRWAMTGGPSPGNYLRTVGPALRGYPYGNSVPGVLPGARVAYPSGLTGNLAGLIGQRIILP